MSTLTWIFFLMALSIGFYLGYKSGSWNANRKHKKQKKEWELPKS